MFEFEKNEITINNIDSKIKLTDTDRSAKCSKMIAIKLQKGSFSENYLQKKTFIINCNIQSKIGNLQKYSVKRKMYKISYVNACKNCCQERRVQWTYIHTCVNNRCVVTINRSICFTLAKWNS